MNNIDIYFKISNLNKKNIVFLYIKIIFLFFMKNNILRRLIKKIYYKTLISKFISSCISGWEYLRDYLYISDTLYSKEFNLVLKRYLHVNFKKDWIGRLYGVINPNIDINGNFDINNIIIEIDGDNSNSNEYVKHWVYKQLQLVSDLFKIERLYNYISLSFEHVGPKNQDNYLLVFDITTRQEFIYNIKRFIKHLFVYILIGSLCITIFF